MCFPSFVFAGTYNPRDNQSLKRSVSSSAFVLPMRTSQDEPFEDTEKFV